MRAMEGTSRARNPAESRSTPRAKPRAYPGEPLAAVRDACCRDSARALSCARRRPVLGDPSRPTSPVDCRRARARLRDRDDRARRFDASATVEPWTSVRPVIAIQERLARVRRAYIRTGLDRRTAVDPAVDPVRHVVLRDARLRRLREFLARLVFQQRGRQRRHHARRAMAQPRSLVSTVGRGGGAQARGELGRQATVERAALPGRACGASRRNNGSRRFFFLASRRSRFARRFLSRNSDRAQALVLQTTAIRASILELREPARALSRGAPRQRKRRGFVRQNPLSFEGASGIACAGANPDFDGSETSRRFRFFRRTASRSRTADHQPIDGAGRQHERPYENQEHLPTRQWMFGTLRERSAPVRGPRSQLRIR